MKFCLNVHARQQCALWVFHVKSHDHISGSGIDTNASKQNACAVAERFAGGRKNVRAYTGPCCALAVTGSACMADAGWRTSTYTRSICCTVAIAAVAGTDQSTLGNKVLINTTAYRRFYCGITKIKLTPCQRGAGLCNRRFCLRGTGGGILIVLLADSTTASQFFERAARACNCR